MSVCVDFPTIAEQTNHQKNSWDRFVLRDQGDGIENTEMNTYVNRSSMNILIVSPRGTNTRRSHLVKVS